VRHDAGQVVHHDNRDCSEAGARAGVVMWRPVAVALGIGRGTVEPAGLLFVVSYRVLSVRAYAGVLYTRDE
jgi:hypothetical protein